MGSPAIDLSGGLVPAQSSVDLSAGLVPAKSDITSNPNGEGTYKMVGAQGQTVSVPFSKVRGAQDQQFQVAPSDASRYQKDAGYSSEGSVSRFAHSLASELGAPDSSQSAPPSKMAAVQAVIDQNPLVGMAKGIYTQGKQSVQEVKEAYQDAQSGNTAGAVVHGVSAIPIAGPGIVRMAEQAPQAQPGQSYLSHVGSIVSNPDAMGTGVGMAAQLAPVAAGAIEATPAGDAALSKVASPVQDAVDVASRVPSAAGKGVAAFNDATYPKNLSIPEDAANAQEIIKALVPDAAARNSIKSASSVIPDVLASAEKNGTPINGKLDLQKALLDRAQEVQGHYDDILRQNAGDINQVPDDYNGNTNGGSNRATLQQISDRVDDINTELKTNNRKRIQSQTTEANAADADLISEKQGLTNILHQRLADLTGLQPEDIAGLRQNAGKMRSLAQEVGLSADNDTTTAGRAETSGGTTSMKNPLEGVMNKVAGGQEIIGNRVLKNAIAKFTPQETPLPQPAAPAPGVANTPEMAQQEFLHSQQLTQAAQDSAAQRSKIFSETSQANTLANGGPSAWATQGYTKVLSHIAQDTSSGLKAQDLVNLSKTPQGAQLFIKASDLTPGSAAMKSLVQQMKTNVGATQ